MSIICQLSITQSKTMSVCPFEAKDLGIFSIFFDKILLFFQTKSFRIIHVYINCQGQA